jgi:predicted ATPase/class 3 adenylate cyclase
MTEERALLLTDVVDSTQLSQQIGDLEVARLWAAHDRLARALLPAWRGREIDKSDGMLLLFDAAADAAQYALAYHRALATLPVPLMARVGLHFGPVILRENLPDDVARGAKPLEVDGFAKPTAARVMSLAMGGQTLLTAAAREALGATELRIQAHGHWHLKGVTEPIELFELGDAQAPFAPPPDGVKATRVVRSGDLWLPVRRIDNNLPQQVTSFIGRRHELSEVIQALSTTRLLTLLGVGGLGKTRLALQVASAVLADYPDGVWLAELAPLSDERQVVQAAASALRVKEVTGLTVLEALVRHVKDRQLLIVLDNCEHLLGACAALARQLLESAPDLKLLATSRERLRDAGEVVYPVPTLPVPEAHGAPTPESLAQNDAVRLFIDRARAVRPAFAVDAHNASAVADICSRLDGIPLALELAAARMRALPVEAIARRLEDRFHLLSGGMRTAMPRQQTLRALIDWSHDLLTPPERALLRRLAVFAGGWTLEAAEAVGLGGEIAAEEILDLLCQLVDKSLVVVEAGAERYRLLETVRAYAQERLVEAGEADATRTRHLAFFLALAEQASRELWGTDQEAWVKRLDGERENILAAHAWCDDDGERSALGLRLMAKLQLYWLPSGLLELGYRITQEALARHGAGASTEDRCATLYAASQLAYFLGRFRETATHGEQSLAIARETGNDKRALDALLMLGYAADELGDGGSALSRYEASIALAREMGDKARLSYALNAMAGHHMWGNATAALPLFEESAVLAREVGDRDALAVTLQNSARTLVHQGHGDRARSLLLESLQIAAEIGATRTLLYVLDACIVLASQCMEWKQAARFFADANAQIERLSLRRTPSDEAFVAPPVARARAAIGETAFADVVAAAHGLNIEQAVAEARAWLSVQT